jgi:hypothetical protein
MCSSYVGYRASQTLQKHMMHVVWTVYKRYFPQSGDDALSHRDCVPPATARDAPVASLLLDGRSPRDVDI